jgi:glycosyltransferase involved in cell wall biosynthesis
LVFREILGFIKGVGGYARSRKSSVSDELRSPDQFRVAARLSPELRKLGKVDVHLEMPLVELIEGRQYCELDVMVFLKRRLVGQFRISSMGSCVSISRLAYAIASHMPSAVLGFGSKNPNLAWAMFYQDLCKTMEDRVFVDLNEVLPSVSVVVATCNRPGSLRKCLQSLCDMAYGGDLEIIVVNNRPGEGRTEDVVREFPFVRVVGESRRGSSFARNAGVAAANGEIIAMTDDDMVVSVEWLDHLVEHFQRADVLAVTGNTLAAKLETQAELDFEKYGGFCRGLASREFSQDWLYRGKAAAPTWEIGGSGNVAFRASIFCDSNIGKFVEVLGAGVPAGVGEDTLMFYQILRSGGKIIYEPTAIAWHHHRVTDGELQRQILAYSKGHVAYHLMTLIRYGDLRSIWRIVFEIPISLTKRIIARVRGRNSYPWKLLITEIIGTLLGPVSLLQSFRHVTRIERKEYSDISANFYSGDREADAPMDPNS